MTDILDALVEEYHTTSSAISRKISKLENADKGGHSMQLSSELSDHFEELNQTLKNLKIQTRTLNSQDKRKYQDQIERLNVDYQTLDADFKRAQYNANRSDLFGNAFDAANSNSNASDARLINSQQQQRSDLESLRGARANLLSTEDQAVDILEDLKRQREVIERTRGNLGEGLGVSASISRTLSNMTRRQAMQKVMWCCVIVFLVAVIGVVIYFMVRPSSSGVSPVPEKTTTPAASDDGRRLIFEVFDQIVQ